MNPEIGYKKTHELLQHSGNLAILHNFRSANDPDAFHREVDPIYIKYGAKSRPNLTELKKSVMKLTEGLGDQCLQLMDKIQEKWQQTYTIDGYIDPS